MDYIKKAKRLHKDNIVIDAHLDLGGIIFERKRKGEKDIIKNLFRIQRYYGTSFSL